MSGEGTSGLSSKKEYSKLKEQEELLENFERKPKVENPLGCFEVNLQKKRKFDPENMEEKTSEGGDDNPSENSERCPCGKCVPVPTRVKSLCCHEVEIINGNLVEGALCITDHPFFKQECLSLESVDLTFRFCRADLTEKPREIEYKRELRKVAYRGFKIWIYDHWYNPLPIPTCVVKSIRNAFPDPRGYYAELLPPHDYLEEEMAFG